MNINIEEKLLKLVLADMAEIFNANQGDYVSTLDFLSEGVLSPAAGIARLKSKGAVIETITKTAIDGSGHTRNRVAHYKIVGWV